MPEVNGLRERAVRAYEDVVDRLATASPQPEIPKDIQVRAEDYRLAALVAGVVVATAGLFILLAGGPIIGILGGALCALTALAARDLYIIMGRVAQPTTQFLGLVKSYISGTPNKAEIFATAAEEGTFILKPHRVRWIFEWIG